MFSLQRICLCFDMTMVIIEAMRGREQPTMEDCGYLLSGSAFCRIYRFMCSLGIDTRDSLREECRNIGMTPTEEAFVFDGWDGLLRPLCERGFLTYKVQEKRRLQSHLVIRLCRKPQRFKNKCNDILPISPQQHCGISHALLDIPRHMSNKFCILFPSKVFSWTTSSIFIWANETVIIRQYQTACF